MNILTIICVLFLPVIPRIMFTEDSMQQRVNRRMFLDAMKIIYRLIHL